MADIPRASVTSANVSLAGHGTHKHAEGPQQPGRIENTYQLKSRRPFKPEVVKQLTNSVLEEELEEMSTYDRDTAVAKAKRISDRVRETLKLLCYDRYKFIVNASVGNKCRQRMRVASHFLWDEDNDNFVTTSFENFNIFAYVSIFAIYCD